jgi:hypothetical protein
MSFAWLQIAATFLPACAAAPPPRFSDEHRVASIIKKAVITDTSQVELTLAALLADYYA